MDVFRIEVQEELATRLVEEPDLNVASPEVLLWVHERFYSRMPERLRWVNGDKDEKEWVEAGVFRNRSVAVAAHMPPKADALDRFLERFSSYYDPAKQHGVGPLVARNCASPAQTKDLQHTLQQLTDSTSRASCL